MSGSLKLRAITGVICALHSVLCLALFSVGISGAESFPIDGMGFISVYMGYGVRLLTIFGVIGVLVALGWIIGFDFEDSDARRARRSLVLTACLFAGAVAFTAACLVPMSAVVSLFLVLPDYDPGSVWSVFSHVGLGACILAVGVFWMYFGFEAFVPRKDTFNEWAFGLEDILAGLAARLAPGAQEQ